MLNTLKISDDSFAELIYSKRFGENKKISNNSDILAHSVAWHRLRKTSQLPDASAASRTVLSEINSLSSVELVKNVNDLDRAGAAVIRKYYGQKIIMWNLRGKELTEFRKTMADFFANESEYFKDNQYGMIYRLPEFYEYDKQIDTLRTTEESHGAFSTELRRGFRVTTATLKPLCKIERNTRSGKFVHYWMKDTGNIGKLVKVVVDNRNQLRHLWEDMFDSSESIKVSGGFSYSSRDDLEHYILEGWKLVK